MADQKTLDPYLLDFRLESPLLGCTTVKDALEALKILEDLRQDEGTTITIFCDNPDFGAGDNAAVEVSWGYSEMPTRFGGETVLECLRAALAADKARHAG